MVPFSARVSEPRRLHRRSRESGNRHHRRRGRGPPAEGTHTETIAGCPAARGERPPRNQTPHVLGRVTVGQRRIRHALPPFGTAQAERLPLTCLRPTAHGCGGRQQQTPASEARDPAFQDQLTGRLAALTGVKLY